MPTGNTLAGRRDQDGPKTTTSDEAGLKTGDYADAEAGLKTGGYEETEWAA